MNEQKQFPRQQVAFVVDGLGTVCGSLMGTSPIATYIESAAGIRDGGRSGITALTCSFYFFVSLFFVPVLSESEHSSPPPSLAATLNPKLQSPGLQSMLTSEAAYQSPIVYRLPVTRLLGIWKPLCASAFVYPASAPGKCASWQVFKEMRLWGRRQHPAICSGGRPHHCRSAHGRQRRQDPVGTDWAGDLASCCLPCFTTCLLAVAAVCLMSAQAP